MNKKILILLLIAILTFSVATVSASDNTTDDIFLTTFLALSTAS